MKKDTRLSRFFISIIVMFVVTTVLTTIVITYTIINRSENYMLAQTQALLLANTEQLGLNINSHIEEIEGNVSLMFSDDTLVNYDASTTTLEQYDQIVIESSIADRIADLGALENYGDFCVIYANDNTVGWKSKTTQNMFSEGGMYDAMKSYIRNDKTQDGWAFGVKGNIDRMYYVKQYNPNALIIASFYTRELEKTFEYPNELEGMNVRLVDNNGYIVYSSNSSEIGIPVSIEDREYLQKKNPVNTITETELMSAVFCSNGWMLTCLVSRDSMMEEFYSLRHSSRLLTAAILIVSIGIMVLMFGRLSKPMGGYVGDLSEKATVDMLSGVLSRRGFEEKVDDAIQNNSFDNYAFVMLDMDNFKQVNDMLGHDYGDEVIARMGRLLMKVFESDENVSATIGRLGGDEFAVFIGDNSKDYKSDICHMVDSALKEFLIEYSAERETIPLSISGGVVMSEDVEAEYRLMYTAADLALYESKQRGKNQYTVYVKEAEHDEK